MRSSLRRIAQAVADRAIDGFLERNAKLPRALFEETRQVIVERESGPHEWRHVRTAK
jgi:hypothetical protein